MSQFLGRNDFSKFNYEENKCCSILGDTSTNSEIIKSAYAPGSTQSVYELWSQLLHSLTDS